MWMPNRASSGAARTPSIHSVASLHSSSRSMSMNSNTPTQITRQSKSYESDNFSDMVSEDDDAHSRNALDSAVPPMWNLQSQQSKLTRSPVDQKLQSEADYVTEIRQFPIRAQYQHQEEVVNHLVDDDATSRSSTLDGEEDDAQYEPKTAKPHSIQQVNLVENEPVSPFPASHVPGPLESQLAALMSKLVFLEQANPVISITAEEYKETVNRLKALEEEKKRWWKRHEAIWALRDEDVENNIKIRGLLASCRRELEATKVLRDEDLNNVQLVRSKLAEKTRELERLQAQTGRVSPSRTRPGSFFERRNTTDLFTAAKVAALEQRALELEKRNSDLVTRLEASQAGDGIDDLNRLTAHQAWKGTVTELESKIKTQNAELERLRPGGGASTSASSGPAQMDWYRIEALLEEHASYRENVGGKLQALRSEKETLQKDLHRKENECQGLELKVQTLQRRMSVL